MPLRTLTLETWLSRQELSEAYGNEGFKCSATTLQAYAARRVGPPYERWGNRARYQWGPALQWARARINQPRPQQMVEKAELRHA